MDTSSFLTSLGTAFLIFAVLVLLFTCLSRNPLNYVVYYPNPILQGLDPFETGSKSCNPFSWVREALASTEQDIISRSGVDSAVYFVFLSTVLGILVLSGLILLPVLLPVAVTDNELERFAIAKNFTYKTYTGLDKLSMANIQEMSPRLWAFLICVYWVSLVSYTFLWKAYRHVSTLRATSLMSPELKVEQFAILVRDIPSVPEGQTRKNQVDTFFQAIYPDTFYRSMLVTDNKEVNKLYQELEGYKKKLVGAEAIYANSKTKDPPTGARPTHRNGLFGLIGERVDSIEFYTEKISKLAPKLESEQRVTLREKQLNSAIVFFTSRVAAASAAQSLHAQIADHWTVLDAPEPRQILWTNLTIKYFERQVRQYIVYGIVALTIIFYMIPISLVSALTTLSSLKRNFPSLKGILSNEAVRTVVEAYLPQLVLMAFLALLRMFLLFLSKAEGIPSESHAVRAATGKYFYFSVLNVFIGVNTGGTFFSTFRMIRHDPKSIVDLLANGIPRNATFFLTFVALWFFVGYGLELSRIIPLIIFHIRKKYFCKTEGEVKEAWSPGDLGYRTRAPDDMLIVTIVLSYIVISPLFIPFGVAYFSLGWLILRNQVLRVYVPSYESYGKMWPYMFIRVLAALVLFQVTMFYYLGTKKFYYATFVVPLMLASVVFGFVCHKKFYRSFHDTALEVVVHELKEFPNMEEVFSAFVPPCLKCDKNDDHLFEDAQSKISRTGSTV